MKKITVLGAGAWGTAFAALLADNGHEVTLWSFEEDVARNILTTSINVRYLPDVKLSSLIHPTSDLKKAVKDADWIFEAVPVKFLRNTASQLKNYAPQQVTWVILSKGIEHGTLQLPSQILDDVFGRDIEKAVVGGPNFAKELARNAYTATTVASTNTRILCELIKMLENDYFIPYVSHDVMGVQLGGAVKNVIALAVGIARGSGQAENTIAYLITEGLDEIARIITHLGGTKETAYRHSGLGDLVLTCLGTLSKNVQVGQLLGQGKTLEQVSSERTTIMPEGINTVQSIFQLAQRENLNLPICQGTYEIIFENQSFKVLLDRLRDYHCMDKSAQGCSD